VKEKKKRVIITHFKQIMQTKVKVIKRNKKKKKKKKEA